VTISVVERADGLAALRVHEDPNDTAIAPQHKDLVDELVLLPLAQLCA